MKCVEFRVFLFGIVAFLVLATGNDAEFVKYSFTDKELKHYREEIKGLFYESLDNYLAIGYPFDELRPISCVANARNFDDPGDTITNDVLGNFTTTLIDSLTTVAIFNDKDRFKELVELVKKTFPRRFDIDSTIQVFETTIRILGSLISSHLYATDPSKAVYLGDEYNGFLLELATDLADRLLPAYLTKTGLPVPRINLRTGLSGLTMDLVQENNIAALGCPMFEFTMLSYLTNDSKYEILTRYAFDKTWSLRSNLDLLPMSLDPQTLQIFTPISGIGASIDSIYEYALKGAILFDDQDLFDIWQDSYNALNINSKQDWFYANVHQANSMLASPWIDSLSAFFPGLQVLNGDIEDATNQNLMSLKLWNMYGGIPERWNFQPDRQLNGLNNTELVKAVLPLEWYPLRPEFIESTYYLYRATEDPFYLNIGSHILNDIKTRFKRKCGLGGIQDIRTGEPQDRMESFVLSETLKYLYLLFDDKNEIHRFSDNIIFSTEAQPMWLSNDLKHNYKMHKVFNDTKYVDHIKNVVGQDELNIESQMKKSKFGKQYTLLKSFERVFPDEKLNDKLENLLDKLKNDSNAAYKPAVCSISSLMQKMDKNNNKMILSSNLLNNFNKLFEIEARYNETLIQPDYMKGYQQIEIDESFYRLWGSDNSKSLARPTTQSFEIIIDLQGRLQLEKLSNGNLHCPTMLGRRKIRLEKIFPNDIDTFGEFFDGNTLATFDNIDKVNPKCRKTTNGTSLPYILKATKINGIHIPNSNNITIVRTSLVAGDGYEGTKKFNLFDTFGVNVNNQLTLDCIPIVNLLLVD